MTRVSRCSLCYNSGHTKRTCPYCCDPEMNQLTVYCYDCTYVSIPLKRVVCVYDIEGKKANVNTIFCGLCESKDIEKIKKETVTIKTILKKKSKEAAVQGEPKEKETCCICFDEYRNNANFAVTLCGHKFCLQCILKHSKEQSKCPICRTDLFTQTEIKVHEPWKLKMLKNIRNMIQ